MPYVLSSGDAQGAEELFNIVETWLPTYSSILLLDPEGVEYHTNDVRQEDQQERMKFHKAFLTVFAAKEIPFILVSGTLEERVATVMSILLPHLYN